MKSNVMSSVDSRTQLAGRNRLELLVFGLGNDQRFGINVFKVREVIRCPKLTDVPHSDSSIRGIADVRGHTITVIDLSEAIGKGRMTDEQVQNAFVIITEYNRAVQGFLVHSVDRIVNLSWKEVLTPPSGTNNSNFLTAVARIDKQLVEIIDVEQIFARVVGVADTVSDDVIGEYGEIAKGSDLVLVVDDSVVARKQVERTLEQMHLKSVVTKNGQEAIDTLRRWKEKQPEQLERLAMVVSDIEMPTMDGYTLTSLIRQDSQLKGIYVILHSSLSGVFNESMVKQVGADRFIPKFHPDDLARVVGEALRRHEVHHAVDEA
ncbi:chemotaxis protein [Guyparkeria halophila]|uniref:Chemotaxis protein n=1 Tax=Guyparkeria halophila TaxID=47960 RepID=A0ABZ0YYH3_9GAMM|nr:chemotaxis protein [Guyparkeria halophila]WQH17091.1 chemotaxis protein [Guyparkeria halophila]